MSLYARLIRPQLPRRDLSAFLGRDYAHRGLWNALRPENSIPAFRAAAAKGYGIELDVHLTRDGALVVHHDHSLMRMCGCPDIIEKINLAQLRTHRLLNTDEPVPTLEEALVATGGVPLIVELKPRGNHARLAESVCRAMAQYPGPWCLECFHPLPLLWLRRHQPQVLRGHLIYGRPGHKSDPKAWLMASLLPCALSRPDFVAHEARSEDPRSRPMRLMRRMKPWLAGWTIRTPEEMAAARQRYDLIIFEGFEP